MLEKQQTWKKIIEEMLDFKKLVLIEEDTFHLWNYEKTFPLEIQDILARHLKTIPMITSKIMS